jgi:hypothetical protein
MRTILLAVLLQCIACAAMPQATATRVLLVGGQMQALPERLSHVASATGRPVQAQATSEMDGEILARGWDIVVMTQDVPSPDRRAQFVRGAKRFADDVRAKGAKPALLMSWPSIDQRAQFRDTIASYREAAKASGAVLVPAAEAWLRALGEEPKLKLYAGEGAQAAPLGDDLAALTLFFALFPAGPQEFDQAYVAKIGRALDAPDDATRDLLIDSATRAIDEPLPLKGR